MLEFSPDIVIGTGGYASYPALRAAIACGIPCAVHESNAVAGLAVKRLSGRLSRVWLNFEDAARDLPKGSKVLTVGNPLPRGYAVPKPACLPQGSERMILSFGGSLGATRINQAVLEMMELERKQWGIFHLHATGKREYEQVKNEFCKRELDKSAHFRLVPFLSDMPEQMAAADLVICRAGAMSISEIAALGRPSILIPSPNVTGNHQYKNAMALAKKEAAICMQESELTGEGLWAEAQRILADGMMQKRISASVRQFHNANVNAVLYADICRLCQKKQKKEGYSPHFSVF